MPRKQGSPPNTVQNPPRINFPHETNWYAVVLLGFFAILAFIFFRITFWQN